jgi:hypothetical protein
MQLQLFTTHTKTVNKDSSTKKAKLKRLYLGKEDIKVYISLVTFLGKICFASYVLCVMLVL